MACQVTPPVRIVDESAELESDLRAALGTSRLFSERGGVTFLGKRQFLGPDGLETAAPQPVTLAFRPTGAFLLAVGQEDASVTRGFDGRTAWSVDSRGVARELGLGSRASLIADAGFRTSLWLSPGQDPYSIDPLDDLATPDELAFSLTRQREPLETTLRIHRDTRRPVSYSMERAGRTRTLRLEDWRETSGVWFPHRMVEMSDGVTVHVDQFETRTNGTPRTFEMPRSRPRDTKFLDPGDGSASARVETRIDRGGRFYVRCAIDSERSAWMLLDTGFGTHAIHAPLAASLGIVTEQPASLLGVSGQGLGQWCEAERLQVGVLAQRSPRLVTIDTAFLTERAGFDVAGVLGAPLFERAIVTLDQARSRVTIEDPAARGSRRRGTGMLVRMDGNSPCVSGRVIVSGRSTPALWFRVDTGSDDSVTVAQWASEEYGLVGDRSTLRTTRLEGAFGAILGWRRRLDEIAFGDSSEPALKLLNPEVTLLQSADAGPLSDPWLAGNVGTRALLGCQVVFDLPGRRVYVSSASR